MKPSTVTFPVSRLIRAAVAIAAALPLALGVMTAAPAQAFTADSPTGIDVSKWQRPGGVAINWEKVAESGETFAFIKATDGLEGDSEYFVEDSAAAAEAGLIIGSYHKAHPDKDPITQADAYVAMLNRQPTGAVTLPPVLDMELDAGMSATELERWAERFLKRVELKTGVTPMIYTYRWFWQVKMGNTDALTAYPLWLAAYQAEPPTDVPGGWSEPLFWQRSSTGRVPGVVGPVDLNTFNGTDEELLELTRGNVPDSATDGTTEIEEPTGRSRMAPNGNQERDAAAAEGAEPGAGSLDFEPRGTGSSQVDAEGNVTEVDEDGNPVEPGDATTDDGTIGGQDDGEVNPVAGPELVDAVIGAVVAGSTEESLADVRAAAIAAGVPESQIDLLIRFLEGMNIEAVPLGLLEDMRASAERAEAAEEADNPADVAADAPRASDLIAVIAGAGR